MVRKLLLFPALAFMMVGCGSPGAPEPPSLNLPAPVANLSAARIGDTVHLAWTMPTHTTDHVALKHPITGRICRAVDQSSCTVLGNVTLAPGSAGTYADELPPTLRQNPAQLLRYEVDLRNHAGKSAGPSNAAYSADGPSPAEVTNLSASVRSDGVVLTWTPASEGTAFFRIERQWLTAPEAGKSHGSPLATPDAPTQQIMVVHPKGPDPGHALDNSAAFNQKYRYVVKRILPASFASQTIEVEGLPSQPIEVSTADVFPPAVPEGLAAVADTASHAIDLSWLPNRESDLAGYRVYRRDVGVNASAQRVASLGMETSYRDNSVQPGHTYAYSVSAIDQNANESKPSAEVEENLP
jgi:hypothetical protein